MLGSIQDRLTRVRPPRVRITYDVETGGALEKKELPFVVGIMAQLGSDAQMSQLPPIKERKFNEIDRDSFNSIMATIAPEVAVGSLPNAMADDPKATLGVPPLVFKKMDDFDPVAIIRQVAPMATLYSGRGNIRFLQSKAEISGTLARYLDTVCGFDEGDDTSCSDARQALLDQFKDVTPAEDDPQKPLPLAERWASAYKAVELSDSLKELFAQLGLEDSAADTMKVLLGQFSKDVVSPLAQTISSKDFVASEQDKLKGAAARIDDQVAEIDRLLGLQLDVIMHDDDFQKLESTWRGLSYLVSRTETGAMLKLKILNASAKDLLADLTKAVEFDQSGLFKMIYEDGYGIYGGMPYSVLIGAYEFGRHPNDMTLLGKLAEVAAASHAPFIAAAYAKLFDLESFESLAKPRDLQKIFESVELASWSEFRKSEDSRYVTLTLPRVLLRLPYGPDTQPCDGLNYREIVGKEKLSDAEVNGKKATQLVPDASLFLWGNPAFVLAERITNAFAIYGWTAAIRGVEGGGLVGGLPVFSYDSDEGDVQMVCPTQVAITDRREKELNDLGFMAICHCKGTSQAAFFGGQTTNLPKKYLSDLANSNAQISAMLPYIMAASRFAHYIKVIMREKVGAFMTRGNVESYLNTWISQYVLLDENAAQVMKAAYPLSAASVTVTDVPGRPGVYKATLFLRPHFQLEELTTSIRLVAELPA
ncbi:type VI secretion system contractile sheath large subunit [Gallaecimonas mangrovi]|uniref:type VI secretion system contractile sheath large subunit n=1 Tax=Gallaecimonas mangrovi TaxID=2291597 RepID=UPI000E208336|nr:type VI secretion system contractile sheath large subunit [Gallaecimonas mangrovi]